jgi:DNA-binding GntR family transcriptional regulator
MPARTADDHRNGRSSDLAERVAQDIQARVASGELPIGSWLRQGALAKEFAVSRTPIREALQTLRERGVVELIPNRGARVRLPTLREIREAYDLRAELEGFAAELAADLISQAQLDRLRDAERLFEDSVAEFAEQRSGASDGMRRNWLAANTLFHEVLQEASCNRLLASTIAGLHRSFPRNLTWGVLDDLRLLEENVQQHRAIREAIEARDGATARRLMVAHVRRSGELIATRAPAGGLRRCVRRGGSRRPARRRRAPAGPTSGRSPRRRGPSGARLPRGSRAAGASRRRPPWPRSRGRPGAPRRRRPRRPPWRSARGRPPSAR